MSETPVDPREEDAREAEKHLESEREANVETEDVGTVNVGGVHVTNSETEAPAETEADLDGPETPAGPEAEKDANA